MPGGRKLFLTHAGELAHRLVSAIARDAMALEFVRRYAQRHERLKVVADTQRLREMESTISREALLLIAAEVRRLLPQAFGFSRNPRAEELALCDVFYKEFLEALGRSLEWPLAEAETEAQSFRRDLETYVRWRERNPIPLRTRKAVADESPFPDRCAILLDSAMMEQARRAAKQFQSDLLRLGTRIFGQLGRLPPQRRVSRDTKAGNKARNAANRSQGRAARDRNDQARTSRNLPKSAHRPRRRR
jgi:hypothetical protein